MLTYVTTESTRDFAAVERHVLPATIGVCPGVREHRVGARGALVGEARRDRGERGCSEREPRDSLADAPGAAVRVRDAPGFRRRARTRWPAWRRAPPRSARVQRGGV